MTIKEIRELSGLSQSKFSEKYKIPKRTLEDWERGKNNPAPYLLSLLEKAVKDEPDDSKLSIYNPMVIKEMGYIYKGLLYVLNERGNDPFGNSEILPWKYFVMVHMRCPSGKIPDDLSKRIAELTETINVEDNAMMMSVPVPMEMRAYWYEGMSRYDSEH